MEKLRKRGFLYLEGELSVEHWVVIVSSEASDIFLVLVFLILSLLVKEYLSITVTAMPNVLSYRHLR